MNILLTGRPGCGKTTVCNKVVERLRGMGSMCGGIICPDVRDECGWKKGTDAVDLMTKESTVMARLREGAGSEDVTVGKYHISPEGIQFCKNALKNAVSDMNCGVVVIDEIGPLELKGGGLIDAADDALNSENNKNNTITVVRSKLRGEFLTRFEDKEFEVFDVNVENRDILPKEILKRIENRVGGDIKKGNII